MKVLIVVDVQKGFMIDKYMCLGERINKYLLENYYDKVIFTKYVNDINQNPLFQRKLGYKKMIEKDEQEIAAEMPKGAIVFEKYGYGLEQKDLQYIKSLNVESLDLCGLESDACVYAVALQLWDEGVYPNILINYVEGKNNMKDIYVRQFGGVDERI